MVLNVYTVIKSYHPHIDEWVDHHLSIGVSKVFVYTADTEYTNDNPKVCIQQLSDVVPKYITNIFNIDIIRDTLYTRIQANDDEYGIILEPDEFIIGDINELSSHPRTRLKCKLMYSENVYSSITSLLQTCTHEGHYNVPESNFIRMCWNDRKYTYRADGNDIDPISSTVYIKKCLACSFEDWSYVFFDPNSSVRKPSSIVSYLQYMNTSNDDVLGFWDKCYKSYYSRVWDVLGIPKDIKKILIIGNRPGGLDIDASKYDLIVRTNRMTNYDMIRTDRTDLWIFDPQDLDKYEKEDQQKFVDTSAILVSTSGMYKPKVDKFIKGHKYAYFDFQSLLFQKYDKRFVWNPTLTSRTRPTTTMWTVMFMLENFPLSQIHLAGMDVEDRSYVSRFAPHRDVAPIEEFVLNTFIKRGRIVNIDPR